MHARTPSPKDFRCPTERERDCPPPPPPVRRAPQESARIGVIVNDLAAINIDKALISAKASAGGGSVGADETIELQNGGFKP